MPMRMELARLARARGMIAAFQAHAYRLRKFVIRQTFPCEYVFEPLTLRVEAVGAVP